MTNGRHGTPAGANGATIRDVLGAAVRRLEPVSESPRLDAELMLARAIGLPRSFLVAHPEDELDDASIERFERTLSRRAAGEPLAYIEGQKEFWSLTLAVSPATLVPRPETEILVGQVIDLLPPDSEADVLDLGTGSGAIALAIASARPGCRVTATDRSEQALAVARLNARQLDLANVEFVAGDWTAPVRGRRFDVIVSNPPYVAEPDPALATLRHEPRMALVAGREGLDALRILAAACADVGRPGATLFLEHGADQEEAVAELLARHGWTDVHNIRDYAGLPRVTVGRLP